jgi:hypothetical protein
MRTIIGSRRYDHEADPPSRYEKRKKIGSERRKCASPVNTETRGKMWAGNIDFVTRCPLPAIEEVPSIRLLWVHTHGSRPQKTKRV